MADIVNYNITKDFESESTGTNFMDVGIHENVELKRVVYDVTEKGNKFLAFYFQNETGEELSHTEWEPKDEDPEKHQSKTLNQAKRVHHIVTKFISKEDFVITANTFEQFAKEVMTKLGNKFVGKKVRIKVIYSWNNYTSLPKYTPFIESMEILKEKSKLKISSTDKMVKDKSDKESLTVVNPFVEVSTEETGAIPVNPVSQTSNIDDLPF